MTSQPILIIDDDLDMREVVRQALISEGYAVIEAATGSEGLQAWDQHDPQLIILNTLLPEMTGWQVLEQIRQNADTPVIMCAPQASEEDKLRAFELGADDYLSQPVSGRELIVRVKAVLRRVQRPPSPTEPTELIVGDLCLDLGLQRVRLEDRTVALTRMEFQILLELARASGRILSREQLVTAVWGPAYRHDRRVLRSAIYRLRQKLERDATQPRYLRWRRDAGYWLAVPEETRA